MTMDLHGQRNAAPNDDGSMVLGSEINHVVGMAPTLLARPPGRRVLHLTADKGGWRMALGDRTASMPGDEFPATSLIDGSGAVYLAAGKSMTLSGPSQVTVRAYANDSVLTFWWL
jgi:hypothetical protein